MKTVDVPRTRIEWLAMTSEEQRIRFIAKMSPWEILKLDAMFETWADQGQIEPSGDGWRTWLMMAGRGFGKTRAGAEWVQSLASETPNRRIALVGATIDEARAVMVEGRSGILAAARRLGQRVRWEPSQGKLSWPNGSEAKLYSGDNPDGLRGPEHHFAWCDELAKWRKAEEAWHNLQFGLRAGNRPRALVTTTPRVREVIRTIRAHPDTVETGGATGANLSLPRAFIEIMARTYGGTRIGRQELEGELLDEAEGSLFPRELIERCRASGEFVRDDQWDRIVVGVDPPASVGDQADACGIIVAARRENRLYVLADATVQGLSPERWARVVAGVASEWNASHVVAEANQGGAMVRSVLEAADCTLRVKLVHASAGKSARAEPVATRFEAGRAFFDGVFPELEAELAGLQIGGGYEGPGNSPDRADAMVWALSELGETRSGVPRVRRL